MRIAIVLWLLLGIVTKIWGQMFTDAYSDGNCTSMIIAKNFTACSNLLLPLRVFNIYLGSRSLYCNYAESFLGRPAENQTEVDNMCPTFGLLGTFLIQQGYDDKANIRAIAPTDLNINSPLTNVLGLGSFECGHTYAQSPNSYTKNQYKTLDQVIWCDNNNALIVRCVNGTRQDWKLASWGKPEPWVKKKSLDTIKSLGMPIENAIDYTDSCPDAPDMVTYARKAINRVIAPTSFKTTLSGLVTGLERIVNNLDPLDLYIG